MRSDHVAWRERVLAYEESDASERAAIDTHLSECANCRTMLQALRDRESRAFSTGQLPVEPLELIGADAEAEQLSANRLVELLAPPIERQRFRPASQASNGARTPRRLPRWVWLVPAAAAAALAVVFMAGPGRERHSIPRIESLAVAHASLMRGANAAEFHTGDAFHLRFRLTAPGTPIVFALDEAGTAELLYPAIGVPARRFAAGDVVLPDSVSAEIWTLSDPPGRETFLAGALRDPAPDLTSLQAELARSTGAATDRAARLHAARDLLERHADSVSEITVSHAEPRDR
ncbi:MAG: DUF4384 domain-containing protein [Candidatus Eisenbacteria bacterium]|uniref:DUF4384 domain-containing protein n=1 Tax=Eiseniibacteriota bacterium TaxID=2212470 RepID=A0A849SRM3_UNCEI|nr:DUF4384 domain-containing protein [Candidatus Eisenbacteria bacterium]